MFCINRGRKRDLGDRAFERAVREQLDQLGWEYEDHTRPEGLLKAPRVWSGLTFHALRFTRYRLRPAALP